MAETRVFCSNGTSAGCGKCNRDLKTLSARKRRAEDPVKFGKYQKQYYCANRARILGVHHAYRKANKGKISDYGKRYQERNKERAYRAMLKRRYGISLEAYNLLLARQGGVCAICHGEQINNKQFAVDHDHVDGTVRGLLCHHCNVAIGSFQDSPTIVESALRYLKQFSQLRLVNE